MLIVRAAGPDEFLQCVESIERDRLIGLELPAESCASIEWERPGEPVAVDFVLCDSLEPSFRQALVRAETHCRPRLVIPVRAPFGEAARRASSLGIPVLLRLGEIEAFDVDEAQDLLDFYLHSPEARGPIEFFHSLALAVTAAAPVNLWRIMEEDPGDIAFVREDGGRAISRRLADYPVGADVETFVEKLERDLLEELCECARCPFFRNCCGYFKIPSRGYDCTGVKKLMKTLYTEVNQARRLLSGFEAAQSDK